MGQYIPEKIYFLNNAIYLYYLPRRKKLICTRIREAIQCVICVNVNTSPNNYIFVVIYGVYLVDSNDLLTSTNALLDHCFWMRKKWWKEEESNKANDNYTHPIEYLNHTLNFCFDLKHCLFFMWFHACTFSIEIIEP